MGRAVIMRGLSQVQLALYTPFHAKRTYEVNYKRPFNYTAPREITASQCEVGLIIELWHLNSADEPSSPHFVKGSVFISEIICNGRIRDTLMFGGKTKSPPISLMINENSVFFVFTGQIWRSQTIFMHWLKAADDGETGWITFVKMVFERQLWKQMLAFHLCICVGPLLGFCEK